MNFEDYGKKLDEVVKELYEHAEPLVDRIKEMRATFNEGMKTADRRGFERAMRLSAGVCRPGHEDIAQLIEKIPYTSVD